VSNSPLSCVDLNGLQAIPVVVPVLAAKCYLTPGCRDWFRDLIKPHTPVPPSPMPEAMPVPMCKVDDFDKKLCDDNYEKYRDACFEQFGNGLKGVGFASNLRGCFAWAEVRRMFAIKASEIPVRA
jgi:hypothetical protein